MSNCVKKFGRVVLLFSVLFSYAGMTHAASLYIDPAKNTLYRGDTVKVAIRVDTDELANECVNAVDAVLHYEEGIEPVDISTGSSIFSMWVEQPTIDAKARTITFAGGIPNGYCGRIAGDPRLTNTLAEVVFRSPGFVIGSTGDNPVSKVTFGPETTAYLNDGRGTKADLTTYGTEFFLEKRASSTLTNEWKEAVETDKFPPQEFSIFLEQNPAGKYYIAFNTTDKETGIHEYRIMEQPISTFGSFEWGRADAPWIVGRSPYILEDQTLNSIIRVKAVDKAGNEYIATYIPEESERLSMPSETASFAFHWVGVGLVLLLIVAFGFTILKRKRRNTSTETKDTPVTDADFDGEENFEDHEYENDN